MLPYHAGAQQYYMKGEVTDEAGKPLQNVNIVLQSTGYVYYTGASGAFGIITKNMYDTLLFSLDGYEKEKGFARLKLFWKVLLINQLAK